MYERTLMSRIIDITLRDMEMLFDALVKIKKPKARVVAIGINIDRCEN